MACVYHYVSSLLHTKSPSTVDAQCSVRLLVRCSAIVLTEFSFLRYHVVNEDEVLHEVQGVLSIAA